jgi:hypothetical protein
MDPLNYGVSQVEPYLVSRPALHLSLVDGHVIADIRTSSLAVSAVSTPVARHCGTATEDDRLGRFVRDTLANHLKPTARHCPLPLDGQARAQSAGDYM